MGQTDIEARLLRIEETEKARGLYHDYAQVLDEPDPATVVRLFTEGAVLHTPGGDFNGRAAILAFYEKAFASDTSVKRHFIVNSKLLDHTPGRVHLASYFFYVGRGDDSSVIGWGTYDDVIDVSGPAPLFAEKTIDVHMGTDLATGWAKKPGS